MYDVQYLYDAQALHDAEYEQAYQQHLEDMAVFWEQHNKIVRLRLQDLQVGDVILIRHVSTELTADHRMLSLPPGQGYYTYDLVGGKRYEQFLRAPESVARWTGRCWHWNKSNKERG